MPFRSIFIAVVIGSSLILAALIANRARPARAEIGAPLGRGKGGDATVTVCHSQTRDLGSFTRQADILVTAMGVPGLITKDMVKPGAVLIDVGTVRVNDPSRERRHGPPAPRQAEPRSSRPRT